MGWFVFAVWLVWDLAAKACRRPQAQMVQTLPNKAITRLEGRGAMPTGRCYRCSTCGTCWPFLPDFSRCINCDSKCWSKRIESDDDVLTLKEARRIEAYSNFERFCVAYDMRLVREELDRLASDLPLYPDAFAR